MNSIKSERFGSVYWKLCELYLCFQISRVTQVTFCYGLALSSSVFSRTTGPILTKLVCIIIRGGNLWVKSVKRMFFFKKNLLHSGAQSIKPKSIVMITKEGSTKIVYFITPGAGVLVQGHGHITHIVKMPYFFKMFFFTPIE